MKKVFGILFACWLVQIPATAAGISAATKATASPAARNAQSRDSVLLKPSALGVLAAGTVFRDCESCPEMVRIPAGSFQMGSPDQEVGRYSHEGPVRKILIAYPLAVGKYPVTSGQWRAFVQSTGFVSEGCEQNPGLAQEDDFPVICVNWKAAKQYTSWLSQQTGKKYRLLSESEYEYANRAGSTTVYPWGNSAEAACAYANVADRSAKAKQSDLSGFSCDDGYAGLAPVGSYKPNAFGLYDMTGNVFSWTEDCYKDSYRKNPTDGAPSTAGDCVQRMDRGSSFLSATRDSRAAARDWGINTVATGRLGFRLARTD